MVYILGLTENISKDQLELHLERISDCEIQRVAYGLDPSVALITFKEKPGTTETILSEDVSHQGCFFSCGAVHTRKAL